MGWFEGKDVDDPLYEFVVVFVEEFGDYFVVVPEYFVEAGVYGVFFELNGMIEDDIKPVFTDVEFGDFVVLDDLPDEVVGSVEHSFQGLVLFFGVFINFIQNFGPDLCQD